LRQTIQRTKHTTYQRTNPELQAATIITDYAKATFSVRTNYIEANEALGKKDFVMRIKICRKEAKESGYWLRLLDCDATQWEEQSNLVPEATELTKIFGAILRKSG